MGGNTRRPLHRVPVELGGLLKLIVLDLRDNQLTSVPMELGALIALKGFDVSGNQLTSVPAELWGLSALTGLNLGENQLTSVPAELAGIDGSCLPRHQTHFRPSVTESNSIFGRGEHYSARHVIKRVLNPRLLSSMASHDVGSTIHQSLAVGAVDNADGAVHRREPADEHAGGVE